MSIRKIREITYITIINTPLGKEEYKNKSFEAIVTEAGIIEFKDWLNGNSENGFTVSVSGFGFTSKKGYDTTIFENQIATDSTELVKQRLMQKLSIQYNELRYEYVKTENIGIPYLNKKTKEEMDLVLRSEIASTEGVEKILEFNSRMVNRVYHLDFKVRTTGGDITWLTIDQ